MVAASLAGDRLVAKTVLDSPRWEVCRRPTALLRVLLSESRTKEMMQPCLIYLHVISSVLHQQVCHHLTSQRRHPFAHKTTLYYSHLRCRWTHCRWSWSIRSVA